MFFGSIRAFLIALFATLGVIAGVILIIIALGVVYSNTEEETYGTGIELQPDEHGNRKRLGMNVPVILEIPINGTIGANSLTGEKIENILLKSREKKLKDDRVKGILLVINSPGGGVNASAQIYSLINAYKKEHNVPVYAYIDGLCASGGYYIACACDKIYSTNISIVGSVGILSWPPFFNVTDTMKKIGVEAMTIVAGKSKDSMNSFRPWKEGEEEEYRKLIDYFYNDFVDVVVSARPQIAKETLINTYGARVFPAPIALKNGYIDVTGVHRKEVLKELTRASGIKEDEKYQVIAFEHKTFYEKIFQSRSPLLTGKFKHVLELPEKWNCNDGLPFNYLYQ